jgi:hypothetical protein
MIRTRAVAGVILATAVAACGPSSDPALRASLPAASSQRNAALSVCDLLAEPHRYDGTTVLVKGSFRRETESEGLLSDVDCPGQPPVCAALPTMRAPSTYKDKLWRVGRMKVVMRGTFLQQASCVFDGIQPTLKLMTVESVAEASASEQEPANPLRE